MSSGYCSLLFSVILSLRLVAVESQTDKLAFTMADKHFVVNLKWDWQTEKASRLPMIMHWRKLALEHLAAGHTWRARWKLKSIVRESHSMSNIANAYLMMAKSYWLSDDFYKVSEMLRTVIDQYAAYVDFDQVIRLEFTVAREYFQGKTDFFGSSYDPSAIEIYEHIRSRVPYHPLAIRSTIEEALLFVKSGQYGKSFQVFEQFLYYYPTHPRGLEVRIAYANAILDQLYAQEGNVELEQSLEQLLQEIDTLIRKKPQSLAEVEKLHQRHQRWQSDHLAYLIHFYTRGDQRDLAAAQHYYRQLLARYPQSEAARKIAREFAGLWSKNE